MPTVGSGKKKRQFGYGKKAKEQAKKYAKAKGLKVKLKSNPGYYAESKKNTYSRLGSLLLEKNWKGKV